MRQNPVVWLPMVRFFRASVARVQCINDPAVPGRHLSFLPSFVSPCLFSFLAWFPSCSTLSGGGGRFQEVGSRNDPMKRKINIWIHDQFPGVLRESGVRMFAHHEICTHGVRALNDRVQPWAMTGGTKARSERFGLAKLGSRESGASGE